ncbi:MAG: hypothetical protein A2253_08340 [Deltaproteobacteria bacterium RIFOXYA2_FULL_55_11]|nr:MAG: hypothetical protein A2253_08340 [Deltaproteobacteria bacterium RIFOXYA2_FULL_55_11]
MSRTFRLLILNTDYPEFLCWLYAQHPGLENEPYDEQMRSRNESLFGVADFYSSNLRRLGHEAWDIHANNEFMQRAWAREHGIRSDQPSGILQHWIGMLQATKRAMPKAPVRYLRRLLHPLVDSINGRPRWFYDILEAQIKHYKPDVLLNQDMGISSRFLNEMKPHVRMLVGQIASPLPEGEEFGCYDLVISSLPNFVEHFRRMRVPVELHRFAFEPKVLSHLSDGYAKIAISFVGSLSQDHQTRVQLLEHLCARLGLKVWGREAGGLSKNSSIRQCYMGRAWGIEMYQILYNSKMTLNHHIGVAESYANNMRLFEATGVGSLLVTDWKTNLAEMFKEGEEVVTYRTPEECAELVRYFLEHDNEREAIARAGQKRTLREHTYYQRMQELGDIVHARL